MFGMKFNIEMIYLPREIFNSRGARFSIRIGKPISWKTLRGGTRADLEAAAIKKIVYNIKNV